MRIRLELAGQTRDLVLFNLGLDSELRSCDLVSLHVRDDPARYGTHSVTRSKATLIHKRTKSIRAIQLLFGHTKLVSTGVT